MIITHLRQHCIAYLALLVAMTGTSYAAVAIANGSVTTTKIADGAVTSRKIHDHSVKPVDLLRPTLFLALTNFAETPSSPDHLLLKRSVAVPRNGPAYFDFSVKSATADCSNNSGQLGLYVDGTPVPNSGIEVDNTGGTFPVRVVATGFLRRGHHVISAQLGCPKGDLITYQADVTDATLTLALY